MFPDLRIVLFVLLLYPHHLTSAAQGRDSEWRPTSNSIWKGPSSPPPPPPSRENTDVVEEAKEDFKALFEALKVFVEATVSHFFEGFLPKLTEAVHRARREAHDAKSDREETSYLDALVTGMGAVMDRQNCRQRVTCNAGKVIQETIPGSQIAVMMLETFVPKNW